MRKSSKLACSGGTGSVGGAELGLEGLQLWQMLHCWHITEVAALGPLKSIHLRGILQLSSGKTWKIQWDLHMLEIPTHLHGAVQFISLLIRCCGEQGPLGDHGSSLQGSPGQVLAAGACPTAPVGSRVAGEHWGSPSPGHRAPPCSGWQAKTGPGHGPEGRLSLAGPIARQGRALGSYWLALLWCCCCRDSRP